MALELLTVNLVPKSRPDVLEGVAHLVFPAIVIRQGVHSGSQGPTFYDLADMQKFIQGWDTKPIMNYHPKNSSGEFVSAANPTILSTSRLGMMLNNRIQGEEHHCEFWINPERVRQIDPRVLEGIQRGLTFEVSTGLFTDNEAKEGTWNGKKYTQIARNYRPDHVAILPDQVGACSVADGCGLFTAAQAVSYDKMTVLQEALNSAWKGEPTPTHNCSCGGKTKETDMNKKQKVDSLISAKEWDESDRPWLEGLEDAKLDRMVKANTDKVKALEDAEKKGKEAEATANAAKDKEAKAKARKDKIDALVESKLFEPGDREFLEKKTDEQLDKLFTRSTAKEDRTPEPQSLKLETVEDVKKHTSGALQNVLLNGLAAREANRARLIDVITSNSNSKFTKEQLAKFDDDVLSNMADLAVGSAPKDDKALSYQSYIGNAGAPPSTNGSDYTPPVLELPTTNYGKKKEEAK